MWSRKRFDFTWGDLAFAAARCLNPGRDASTAAGGCGMRADHGAVFACLSVRSGLDLLLTAARYPRGSEMLVSAITIPDMVRIIRHHGLVPVPLDLDPELALPSAEQIATRVTPRTKAVLIAHLFGAAAPLDAHIAAAREHGLLFIEDCAQAFRGPEFAGHPDADVSLFSFGTIKTASALGGALARVRDEALCAEMQRLHAAWSAQSRRAYLGRVIKYMTLKALSYRLPLKGLVQGLRLLGLDYDRMLNASVSGFDAGRLFESIRRQPCGPLLELLQRRIARFDPRRQQRRAERGRRLAQALRGSFPCPAAHVSPHVFWVFPILADAPDAVGRELFRHGFDATQGHSMIVVDPPPGCEELEPREARRLLSRILFLPFYDAIPDGELERMAAVLDRFAAGGGSESALPPDQAAVESSGAGLRRS